MENAGHPPAENQPSSARPLIWVAFWLMISFFVATGINQYLNPIPPTLKELEPLLLSAKKEPGPLKPMRVETFERSLNQLKEIKSESRLVDLLAVTRFDAGRDLTSSELGGLSEKPLGIPRELFQRIYRVRKEPVTLSAADKELLSKAPKWDAVVRADAAIATPAAVTATTAESTPEIPLVTRAFSIAFVLISWAVGRYYLNGWRLKTENPGLPLPLAWQPANPAEAESVALRVLLLPILGILAFAAPVPPELNVALGLGAVVFVCATPIRGYRIPWAQLLGRGARNPVSWGLGTYIGGFPILAVTFVLSILLTLVLPSGSHSTTDAIAMDPSTLPSAIFTAVMIAPIFEEVLFRGVLLGLFTQLFGRIRYGILASSAVFAMIHMQGPPSWPVLFALGSLASFAYIHTRSLWSAIILHAAHNATILLVTLSVSQ